MTNMTMVTVCAVLVVVVVATEVVILLSDIVLGRRQRQQVSVRAEQVRIRREQFAAEQKLRTLTEHAMAEMLRVAREESGRHDGQQR